MPLLTEMLHFNPVDLFPKQDDMMALSKRVKKLNIKVNTQNLKVEKEKLKCQRLGTTLKRMSVKPPRPAYTFSNPI